MNARGTGCGGRAADTGVRVRVGGRRNPPGRWLRDRDNHLLDGPSPRFPEMTWTP